MCGILSVIRFNEESLIPPHEISLWEQTTVDEQFHVWETTDTNNFLAQDHKSSLFPLSDADIKKLNNLDRLRQLNVELGKLNNTIKKKHKSQDNEIDDKIRLIKLEIDQIVGEDEQSTSNEHNDITEKKNLFESLIYRIASRGPDYLNYTNFANKGISYQLFSSILSLRQPFTSQPIIISHRYVLQFNGELYNDECLLGNDTKFFMQLLEHANDYNDIIKALNDLYGEFAFALYDLLNEKIYFGRDRIGKRSLVYSIIPSKALILSSVPYSEDPTVEFIECKNNIYDYNLQTHDLTIHNYNGMDTIFKPLSYSKEVFSDSTYIQSQIDKVYQVLKSSTLKRQLSIHPLHHDQVDEASLAILFSGGLDCTVIAGLIAENILEQKIDSDPTHHVIDLLTVGFDNPRTNQLADKSPDRVLAKKSWFHLQCKYPSIQIRLIEINVSYENWLIHKQRVMDLMYPCNTEMDLSIAIAFYFASSKNLENIATRIELIDKSIDYESFLKDESSYVKRTGNYQSTTKVLFSGLGADELFAGYSRHESIFQNVSQTTSDEQLSELYSELSTGLINDIEIIHTRNLGRDDRVICCWGKELRYPYLDEKVITTIVNEVEPSLKFHYEFELTSRKNKPDVIRLKPTRKYLLRRVASDILGLEWVKDELKRAIQFGAKSAKLEIGQNKIKGTAVL
ncbi:glucosamine 6-phosphate synthetase [Scheffersomyces amazonensis]|uniref:glucosamine 6-phosphate synthetase n=1 Tax=Scheffersomyces amazonensis TaxID=1078765 RepID=UPI00315D9AD5